MKSISIDASPKQLSRLRNGHRVRVKPAMAGKGYGLLIDPSRFDSMSRAFTRGTAVQLQLSPDELMANKQAAMSGEMEGQGIMAGGRIKMPSAKKIGSAIVKAEKAVRKNPTSRAIVKKVLPIAAKLAVTAAAQRAGLDPATTKELSGLAQQGSTAGLTEAGYGLYAGAARGGAMMGCAMPGPRSRMPEMSSLAIGGNLLATHNSQLPPALQSQAMGANFNMNTQLPPSYQRGGVRFV